MTRAGWFGAALALALAGAAGACSVGKASPFTDGDGPGSGNAGAGASGTGVGGEGNEAGFNPGSGGGSQDDCLAGPDEDQDADGFTINQGDCNDCDGNVNPDAIEVATDPNDPEAEPADENCDGTADEPFVPCDGSYDLADPDPFHAAHAIELCHQTTSGTGWGLVDARWVRANGTAASASQQVGILSSFGPNMPVRAGGRLLGLSSGRARLPGQPGACGNLSCSYQGGAAPPGFPQDVPNCEGGTSIYDDIGLEVTLRAPSNADGYQFDFAFYSFEFPEYVCTEFNDQFIALANPAPPGAINGNISFDSQTNPVSVNIAMFDHCDPAFISQYASNCWSGCPSPPNPYCPNGAAILQGTGFDAWDPYSGSGSTGWLVTTAPIGGGEELTLRFAIWDTGDMNLDSTTLLDNFTWLAQAGTVAVGTQPVPR